MTILVTGATGEFGQDALKSLKELLPQEEIFALARNQEKATDIEEAGFKIRIGDYDQLDSLKEAFKGIDRLLFVSGNAVGSRKPQHKNVVEAAKTDGVKYIAYTSFGKADTSASPLAEEHAYTEKLINEAQIPHTFLRNNWYLENELPLLGAARQSGQLIHNGRNGKAGWALTREYAEVAARAVSGKFDFPEVLELGGPLRSYQELGDSLAAATGKDIEVISGNAKEAAQALVDNAGLPQSVAETLVSFQQVVGSSALEVAPVDFTKYLGHPLTKLSDAIKEIL